MSHAAWFWAGGLMLAVPPLQAIIYPSLTIPAVIALGLGLIVLSLTPELVGRRAARTLLVVAGAWIVVAEFVPLRDAWSVLVVSIAEVALLAVIAADFGRNDRLPAKWRWAPAWTLLVVVALGVVAQVLPVPEQTLAPEPWILLTLTNLALSGAPIFLGVCAVMFGVRQRVMQRLPERELVAAE